MIEQLNIRQMAEESEQGLSPFAARSALSQGRLRYEAPCPIRLEFQRDRDRIIHCKAFRRLKHKTQVFIAPLGDHYVTRLTHTLEVAQIARTISRALGLNEDLTEAIALGHDLGHTPFGHVGEDLLNELFPPGFRHNEQSLRVVDILEQDGQGLNLTWEVRDGIRHHSKTRVDEILGAGWGEVATLEGEVVKIADIVAYVNHDIGDAIRAGLFSEEDLPPSATAVLGHSPSQRINWLVRDIVAVSWSARGDNCSDQPQISMSPPVLEAINALRTFLLQQVYNPRATGGKAEEARQVIRLLYHYFSQHEGELPAEYRAHPDDTLHQVVDYIAGMTDRYALRLAEELKTR